MADSTLAASGAVEAAGEAGAAFPPFDPALFSHQLFWFALTFGALYFFVSTVAIPRLRGAMEARAAKVSGDIDAAASANANAQEALKAQEAAAASARTKARGVVDQTRAAVNAEIAVESAKTEEALAQTLAAGEHRIADMRTAALSNVAAMASGLVGVIAAKVAGVTATDDEAAAAVAAISAGAQS